MLRYWALSKQIDPSTWRTVFPRLPKFLHKKSLVVVAWWILNLDRRAATRPVALRIDGFHLFLERTTLSENVSRISSIQGLAASGFLYGFGNFYRSSCLAGGSLSRMA